MKKTFLVVTLAAGVVYAQAQRVDESKVPAPVKKEFKSLYPKIDKVKWEKENGNYEANFDEGKTEMAATITPSGKLVETETGIEASALPKAAADYLSKNVPGKKIHDTSRIKDASGKITYEAEVDGIDYTFDSNGNFLKKEADND